MNKHFNADEIFEIAQQIERNGIKFYTKAAAQTSSMQARELFEKLIEMEKKHLDIYIQMRENFQDKNDNITYDPDNASTQYLNAIASGKVFSVNEDPSEFITDITTTEEILSKAVDLEKNSIIFYIGLKDLVVSKSGKREIGKIIQQELGHIVFLNSHL